MLLLSEPKAPGGLTFATGQVGTFTDVLDASWESTRYAWNANSRWRALEDAYDRRIAAVKDATGQTLDNPLRAVPTADDYREIARRTKASGKSIYLPDFMDEKFQSQLARIAESNPDKLGVLRPHVPTVQDAADIVSGAEQKLSDVLSRTSGLTGTLANLAGGVGASFEDPATYALAPIGFSGRASKSLLWNALRAAASNAGAQAITEPFIQQWRAEAGLEAGILPGLQDVAFAGAVGGGLDFAVRGLVRGGKLATGASLAPPPAIERGATIEDAIPRLPDDNPIKAAAKGDTASLVTAVQKIEGHLTPTERGALRALEDDTGMKIDAGEDLAAVAQALRHAEDPIAEPLPVHEPDPAPVAPAKADAAPAAPDAPVDDVAARLSEGRGSAIETAAAFRARPELIEATPLEGKARTARSLARLADPAFEMVQRGQIKEDWGALVGDHVADPAEHAPVLQKLAELQPETAQEARRIIAEETVKPATPRAVEAVLGGATPAPVERALQQVAHAIQSGTVPAKRAREALKRRMASGALDDDAPAPPPRGLDEPAGPEAKAQVDAMLAERKSRLGKGLKDITAEQKGGQAAVDRVAGRGGKPKFSLSGLDLSPEARKARAEAQGFDTSRVWYHGTHADFAAFDVSKADAVYGRAIYLAETPEVSSRFAKRDGGRLLQLYVKRGNYFDPMSADGQEALKRFVMDERQGRHIDGVPAEKILKWAAEGDTQTLQYEPIQEWMKKKGYDGWFEIEGVDGGPRSLAVFDPSSIRSTSAAFDPGNAGRNGLLFSLSPAAAAAMPDVRVKLNEIAATLPKAVRIRLYDRLTFSDLPAHIQRTAPPGVEAKTIQGLWDPEQMVIHLALSTADPVATLRHEQVHMMRALGLLSDADYRRLVRHAEKIDARKAYKIDATYGATIKAQSADKIEAEARLVEETVAHLVADRLAGKTIGGGLDKVLKPIRDFLRKLRDALGLKGLRTVEDVFAEIERGGHRFDPASSNPDHPAWNRLDRELSKAQKAGAALPDQADPRMARARELGFDTTRMWYRGTRSNRQADRFRVSENYGVVYVTNDPKVANRFARQEVGHLGRAKVDEGARVYPLLLRADRLFDPTNAGHAKRLRLLLQRRGTQISRKEMGAHLVGANEAFLERADVQAALKDLGYSGYLSQQLNVNDSAAIFNPADLRSPWAEFAPARADENGLLFSLSPDDAEAALGVRLGEAELRGKVGAAARKLAGNVEMQASWIEGMGLEAGDAEEIVKLYTGFLTDFRKIMDDSTAKRLARDKVADLLEVEATQRKRVALLQLEATTRAREVLSTHKNARGEVDPAQAMIGTLEHYGLEGTPIQHSVEGKRKAIMGRAHAQMEELLWNFRKTGFSGRRMNSAQMPNVVRELFGEDSGDEAAKALAKAWSGPTEELRQRFNQAGGAVGKLEKWGLPQIHDARALKKRGLAQWKADTLALLDPAKMRHPLTGEPMTAAQVAESLDVVFKRIVTDGLIDAPDTAGAGRGALYKQHAEHRFLVFKDADAWLKYQGLYGTGGPEGIFGAMMNHVNVMARDIAAMEVLGPNPGLTLEAMIGFVRKEGSNAAGGQPALFPTKSPKGLPWDPAAYMAGSIRRARDMWSHMHGEANVPVNGFLANTLSAVRNITFGTSLGSATLSSLSDLGRQQIHRRFAGVFKRAHGESPLGVVGDLVQQFKSLNRREAVRSGLILDSALHVLHANARYAGGFNGPMWSQVVADRMLTWGLLTPWTQANRHVFGLSIMAEVADNVGKKFDALDPALQRFFGRYGMGAAEWDAIRQFEASIMGDAETFLRGREPASTLDPKDRRGGKAGQAMAGKADAADFDPIRYLKPSDIKDTRLAERYLEMILQETERAVPSGTVANKALWVGPNQPGTFRGELLRTVSMLKSYGTIVLMQDWGRFASEIAQGRPLRGARFMAAIAISSTVLGALAMQLKSLSRGEDPRPMDDPNFWGAALLQGGGLGIYGDYLFGSVNRFGGGFAGSLAGPVTSRASNLWNLTGGNLIQLAQDEPTNFGREAVSFARMNLSLPFYARLAYERILLDELQKSVDPQARAAFRRKASKLKTQFKTGYWWAPGESAPARAPDWGNIAP